MAPIGLGTVEAVLGTGGALATGTWLWYRYWWGARSHVSLSEFRTMIDSGWNDGRNNDNPVWTRRLFLKASNDGWRDGYITKASLNRAVLRGPTTEVIDDPSAGVYKIVVEHADPDSRARIDIDERAAHVGQPIPGRGDVRLGVVPFILQESALGREMERAKEGEFHFEFRIEDNKRVYTTGIALTLGVADSAGGKLAGESGEKASETDTTE